MNTEIKKAIVEICEKRLFAGLSLVSAFIVDLKPVYGHDRASDLAEYLFHHVCYCRRKYGWSASDLVLTTAPFYELIKRGEYTPGREEFQAAKERLAAL